MKIFQVCPPPNIRPSRKHKLLLDTNKRYCQVPRFSGGVWTSSQHPLHFGPVIISIRRKLLYWSLACVYFLRDLWYCLPQLGMSPKQDSKHDNTLLLKEWLGRDLHLTSQCLVITCMICFLPFLEIV